MTRVYTMFVFCCVAITIAAQADDIDIYLQERRPADPPYVHLILDYHYSQFEPFCRYGLDCRPPLMSGEAYSRLTPREESAAVSRHEVFTAVLMAVLAHSRFDDVRLAVLVSNYDTATRPEQHGATLLQGYQRLGDSRGELATLLGSIPAPPAASAAHAFQPRHAYYEWFQYLNGYSVVDGTATAQNFSGDPAAPVSDASILEPGAVEYSAPDFSADSCSRFYSILMAIGPVSERDDIAAMLESNFGKEAASSVLGLLRSLHSPDTDLLASLGGIQPVTRSWMVSTSEAAAAALPWGAAGGTGAALDIDNPQALQAGLTAAFETMIDTSGTLVNTDPGPLLGRSEYDRQLFLTLFQPRESLRWPGNVKKLRISAGGRVDEPQRVVDALGVPAIESEGEQRGKIRFDALSMWTDALALEPGDGELVPLSADGPVVTRGGAGQRISGLSGDSAYSVGKSNSDPGARQVLLEPLPGLDGEAGELADFDATELLARELQSTLGVPSAEHSLQTIRWGRGLDVDDEDGDGAVDDARPWLLGAVLHSTPLLINYGAVGGYTAENPNQRIFFGSSDGLFHALENTEPGGAQSGREIWSFYPREMLRALPSLRRDSESSLRMHYGVDGAPSALIVDRNEDRNLEAADGDRAIVFFGLRRGGSSYYALDVSEPDSRPKLLWKISRTIDGDFDELGMSFSQPVTTRLRFGEEISDVVIFAGGYNGGWAPDGRTRIGKDGGAGDDSVGNAIFIVDARSGALIWKVVAGPTGSYSNTIYRHADLVNGIPSRVSVLEDSMGVTHRVYVGDTGGTVWRLDLPPGSGTDYRKNSWFVSPLAVLAEAGPAGDRRFFHAPDVVRSVDERSDFDGVLIASGDRAHPRDTRAQNYLYYLKDRLVASGVVAARDRSPLSSGLADQSTCIEGDEAECATNFLQGWRIALPRAGEKGLSTPLLDSGTVFLSTYAPTLAGDGCSPPLGQGYIYSVKLRDGTADAPGQRAFTVGPGIPPDVLAVDDLLLMPGGGAGPEDAGDESPSGELVRREPGRPYRIYWRQPGADPL